MSRPLRLLLYSIPVFLVMAVVGNLLAAACFAAAGIDFSALTQGELAVTENTNANWLRLGVLLNNLLMFAGTATIVLLLVYRKEWIDAAGFRAPVSRRSVIDSTVFFVAGLPLVAYVTYLNLRVDLPEWADNVETSTNEILQLVLGMNSFGDLLMAFLTIAVTAGLGEELLLRGVVQRRILWDWMPPHAAIWVAAVLFSTLHFEFAGWLPRILLGAFLGYTYYWTKSLWVPIFIHLAFNGIQVIVAYATGEVEADTTLTDPPAWYLVVLSTVIVLYYILTLPRKNKPYLRGNLSQNTEMSDG